MTYLVVGAFPDAIQAHLAIARLEAEGIRCRTADEHIIGADWLYSGAVGGVKVEVELADVEAARAILRSAPVPLPDPEPGAICPGCGSADVDANSFSARIALFVVALYGIPLPWGRPLRCNDCGRRWRPARRARARNGGSAA